MESYKKSNNVEKKEALKKRFDGLSLKNEQGFVSSPLSSELADLSSKEKTEWTGSFNRETIDFANAKIDFQVGDEIPMKKITETLGVSIDSKELDGVLIEVFGKQLFKVLGRLVVVAKVRDGHLPFYKSSKGTSGKNAGEWYPFFGFNGEWLIKGDPDQKTGKMEYSSAITEVQEKLNENLQLPHASYFNENGSISNPMTGEKLGDLEGALDFLYMSGNDGSSMYTKDVSERDEKYISSITGYVPKSVERGQESADKWISSVVNGLG